MHTFNARKGISKISKYQSSYRELFLMLHILPLNCRQTGFVWDLSTFILLLKTNNVHIFIFCRPENIWLPGHNLHRACFNRQDPTYLELLHNCCFVTREVAQSNLPAGKYSQKWINLSNESCTEWVTQCDKPFLSCVNLGIGFRHSSGRVLKKNSRNVEYVRIGPCYWDHFAFLSPNHIKFTMHFIQNEVLSTLVSDGQRSAENSQAEVLGFGYRDRTR